MIEDFIEALKTFSRQRTRTVLSLLGVIIGVAAVIIITSIGQADTNAIKDSFGTFGLNIVQVQKGFMRKKRSGVTVKFDEAFREGLFDNIENISHIWYKNSLNPTLNRGDVSSTCSVNAVECGYLEMYGFHLSKGRFFSVTEDVMGLQRIILGSAIAEALFPNTRAIGRSVLLTTDGVSFSFKVVGVLKKENAGFEDTENSCFIPRGFYAKKVKPNPAAQNVMVEVVDPSFATTVVKDIQSYCDALTGVEYSVYVMSMQSMIEQISDMQGKLAIMLSSIAAISLLVGGIGIMNIMIVSVTERKKEIGIRKALGATRALIARQFLIEAATITTLGGAIGEAVGVSIAFLIEALKHQRPVLDSGAMVTALVFSLCVGIFFGLNPALKASQLDPVVALSAE